MLTVQQALEMILADTSLIHRPSLHTETVDLLNARNRVLAADQIATIDVPPWDNSAMDGYALFINEKVTSDLETNNLLTVSQIIPAGVFPLALQPGTAARIFTGAPIPAGANAVEMQENTKKENDCVTFLQKIKAGANIRRRGEDIKKDSVIVKAGVVLKSSHLGLLASVGIKNIPVTQKLRVVVLSTGDELAEPGSVLKDGQIYNSNRYLLLGLLQEMGFETMDGGMIEDDAELTKKRLLELSAQGDVIISSGGVSVGEEDHVKAALEVIGKLNLWKIAVKPGKPLAFGSINNSTFFGLPGNPVSAFVTFLIFVKPYLLKAQGATNIQPQLIEAIADFDWPPFRSAQGASHTLHGGNLPFTERSRSERKPIQREEYLRARLKEDGKSVEIYPNQSSGALSSVVWANGLAVAPVGAVISRGDKIKFLAV